ncbi:MAG TPA: glutamine--tRNA ligase, partial [Arachidicoccus soli]|nr:glutamine--tRNA ligase [Arachidicoccus soli]
YTPKAIRDFCERIGVAKRDNLIDLSLLEFFVREDLNKKADRRMVVFDPLKVVITNYPDRQLENLSAENNPEDADSGTRNIPFTKEIYIERDDFMENPPKKYFRLAPGQMVRLKYAYIIRCDEVVKDEAGNITEVHCSYLPESKSGDDSSGIKIKGTLHWVSIAEAKHIEIRLYDRLFTAEDMDDTEGEYTDYLNEHSLQVIQKAYAEPALLDATQQTPYQFLRKGYFILDKNSSPDHIIFNRTVGLKDSWAKEMKK